MIENEGSKRQQADSEGEDKGMASRRQGWCMREWMAGRSKGQRGGEASDEAKRGRKKRLNRAGFKNNGIAR